MILPARPGTGVGEQVATIDPLELQAAQERDADPDCGRPMTDHPLLLDARIHQLMPRPPGPSAPHPVAYPGGRIASASGLQRAAAFPVRLDKSASRLICGIHESVPPDESATATWLGRDGGCDAAAGAAHLRPRSRRDPT